MNPAHAIVAAFASCAATLAGLPPVNELCTDAVPLTPPEVLVGSLINAGADGGTSCAASQNPDAWYRFDAPAAGTLTITTCGTNDAPGLDRGMDTILSLHAGCPGEPSNEIACNDNWFFGDVVDACAANDAGLKADSAVSTRVAAGEQVLVRVTYRFGFIRDGLFFLNADFLADEPPCPCERGGDPDIVDVFDLLVYLDDWFAMEPAADLAQPDGVIDVFDLLRFLECWFPASTDGMCA